MELDHPSLATYGPSTGHNSNIFLRREESNRDIHEEGAQTEDPEPLGNVDLQEIEQNLHLKATEGALNLTIITALASCALIDGGAQEHRRSRLPLGAKLDSPVALLLMKKLLALPPLISASR
jgi:hypothetical protein